MPLPSETQVMIVGAGPTGLAMAVRLAASGIPFVIADKLTEPQDTSRAAAVHARTLEVLERLGVADVMVAAGRKLPHAVVSDRDTILMRIEFSKLHTRYPFILGLPQNQTEAILTRRLLELGGSIQRGQQAVEVHPDRDGASIVLKQEAGSTATVRARYVVGADGYHSVVRQAAGIGFAPGTYPQSFVLADVHMEWKHGLDELGLFLVPSGIMLVAPFSDSRFRIVATADEAPSQPDAADVQAILDQRGPRSSPGRVHDIVWSSRFRIHHGVAAAYRAGPCLLAGDAAHVHSPAGGQGMNTGIQDAVSLADRLIEVIRGHQQDTYLNGYGTERRPVAERVVAMTDRMTRMATLNSSAGRQLRNLGMKLVNHLPAIKHMIATNIAELNV